MFEEPAEARIPEEKLRELSERLEDRARKRGLYLAGIAVSVVQDPEGTGTPAPYVVQATFQVGSVAFSLRVQDPEQDAVEDQVREFERDISEAQWNELREQYRQRRESGEDPLA